MWVGHTGNRSSARLIARKVAPRMFNASIPSRSAHATAQAMHRARMSVARRSRSSGVRVLESARPRIRRLGSRMTAAATTGPARGPLPASSTPATRLSSTASPTGIVENCRRGALSAAAPQRLMHTAEFLLQLTHVLTISQLSQQRFSQSLTGNLLLEEFWQDAAANQKVRLRKIRDLD